MIFSGRTQHPFSAFCLTVVCNDNNFASFTCDKKAPSLLQKLSPLSLAKPSAIREKQYQGILPVIIKGKFMKHVYSTPRCVRKKRERMS